MEPINIVEELKKYLKNTPKEQRMKDWDDIKEYGEFGPTVDEFLYKNPIAPPYNPTLEEIEEASFEEFSNKTNRGKEIINASLENSRFRKYDSIGEEIEHYCGFREGALWADANPSDETICKVLNLWAEYNRSLEEFPEHSEEPGTTASEACYKFIRENWNNIKV